MLRVHLNKLIFAVIAFCVSAIVSIGSDLGVVEGREATWRDLTVYGLWARISRAARENRPSDITVYMSPELAQYSLPVEIKDPNRVDGPLVISRFPWTKISQVEMSSLDRESEITSLKIFRYENGELWLVQSNHNLNSFRRMENVRSWLFYRPDKKLMILDSDLFLNLGNFSREEFDPRAYK